MMEIREVADLVSISGRLSSQFGTRLWWRGETEDFETRLVPGMLRKDRGAGEEPSILLQFRQRAGSRRSEVPAEPDKAGWLFLMQHHGLPTRILDWSENPLAALYFAVESETNATGVLWGVSPTLLNKSMMGQMKLLLPNHTDVASILNIAFTGKGSSEKVIAVLPMENDLKMMLQASRFTIHGAKNILDCKSDKEEYLTKFTIPPESKSVLKEQLDALGIRRSSLFPDLTSLAADVGAKRYVDPQIPDSDT